MTQEALTSRLNQYLKWCNRNSSAFVKIEYQNSRLIFARFHHQCDVLTIILELKVMDDKCHQTASTNNFQERHHFQQQHEVPLDHQISHENFNHRTPSSQSPKVTVSLPKHAALKLHDLAQRRDVALLKLGIVSVQFENDQIIRLTQQNAVNSSTNQKQPNQLLVTSSEANDGVEPMLEDHHVVECLDDDPLNVASITSLTALRSPNGYDIEDEIDMDDTKINSPMKPPSTIVFESTSIVSTTPTSTPTTCASSMTSSGVDMNTNNLAAVYGDDDEDDKDENEVVNEVENQHSSYDIHQLSQLDFADPVDLEMYDSDNLLFPDYTLNLS